MQEHVLAQYPDAPLRVYAIWTDKLSGDSRRAWDRDVLTNPRVTHFWDGRDLAGHWFVTHLPGYRGSDWDAYLLFGPDATWQTLPMPLVSAGSTVIAKKDEIARAIAPWVATPVAANEPLPFVAALPRAARLAGWTIVLCQARL